jgi:hypothetical protein
MQTEYKNIVAHVGRIIFAMNIKRQKARAGTAVYALAKVAVQIPVPAAKHFTAVPRVFPPCPLFFLE